ncbi:MAG: hypothetical protein JPMHGGIA_01447 [Saprospiraceae bacterium]|nr:hypothetical protein [Saprospiraceae bacterium]
MPAEWSMRGSPICCLWLALVSLTSAFAQERPLWKEYRDNLARGSQYAPLACLVPHSTGVSSADNPNKGVLQFDLLAGVVSRLLVEGPEQVSISLTAPGGRHFTLMLVHHNIFGPGSRLLQSDGSHSAINASEARHYRGVVAEYPQSFAALSAFDGELAGVISIPEAGNFVLGKTIEQGDGALHILYAERDQTVRPLFECATMESPLPVPASPDTIYPDRCKTVKIFLECDYQLFLDRNKSAVQVKNYVGSLFNVVKTLYYNDGIGIEISDIMVWTTKDPFLHTELSSILYHYSGYRQNNFTGNLAQLVTTYKPAEPGGVAFLGTLCYSTNGAGGPHSFAYIYNSFNQLPAYSWSVEVMAHELGHNFGSPHTHACAWGPFRNEALDNCRATEGGCTPGPMPTEGGTIMSYCHLTSYGINFSKGFGAEPAALLRYKVQTKSCVLPAFLPETWTTEPVPHFEGDGTELRVRPVGSQFQYDWYHYDYQLPAFHDTVLPISQSGIYRAAVSDRCTEYSAPDTIQLGDFLVNLGCPVIPGFRDSASVGFTMIADQGTNRDSLVVPQSLYASVPAWARDVHVALHMTVRPNGKSWTRDVITTYTGPPTTGIANPKHTPNSIEPAGFDGIKTYTRILGNFDPAGTWHFITNDNKFDAGVDAMVDFSIAVHWRSADSVAQCALPLCDGQSRTFDAGIRRARYLWSTGDTTKTVSVEQPGPLWVEVWRGTQHSRHEVNLYVYDNHFSQQRRICQGDTLRVGLSSYHATGVYRDTLEASNGCDSLLTTELEVLPVFRTSESLFLCYADSFAGKAYYSDAVERFHFRAVNGCDSLHEVSLVVNPEINVLASATPACPESGGALRAQASGGSGGDYRFFWSGGREGQSLDSLPTGDYTLRVIDSAGCSAETRVTLINLDAPGVVSLIFDVDCFGDQNGRIYLDFVSGRSPIGVLWSSGATTKDLLGVASGRYTAFLTDANGCKSVVEVEVGSPELLFVQIDVAGSTGSDGRAKGSVFGGTNPYLYLWSNGDRTPEITGLSPGQYTLWIDDSKGCKASAVCTVPQLTATGDTNDGIPVRLYPNPANERLLVLWEKSAFSRWSVRDLQGRLLLHGTCKPGTNSKEIPLQGFAGGLYRIELSGERAEVWHSLFSVVR